MGWMSWTALWVVSAVLVALVNCYIAGEKNVGLRDHFEKDPALASVLAGPLTIGLFLAFGLLWWTYFVVARSITYARSLRPFKAAGAAIAQPFLFAYKVGGRKHQPQLPEARIR